MQESVGWVYFRPFWFQTWILLWKLKLSLCPSGFSLKCRFKNWNRPWSFQFQTCVLMLFQTFKLARLVYDGTFWPFCLQNWMLFWKPTWPFCLQNWMLFWKLKSPLGHSEFRFECYLRFRSFGYIGYAALQLWILASFLLTTFATVY